MDYDYKYSELPGKGLVRDFSKLKLGERVALDRPIMEPVLAQLQKAHIMEILDTNPGWAYYKEKSVAAEFPDVVWFQIPKNPA